MVLEPWCLQQDWRGEHSRTWIPRGSSDERKNECRAETPGEREGAPRGCLSLIAMSVDERAARRGCELLRRAAWCWLGVAELAGLYGMEYVRGGRDVEEALKLGFEAQEKVSRR